MRRRAPRWTTRATLLDNVQYAPTRGRYKVYLIDEVHMLSNHSFNALAQDAGGTAAARQILAGDDRSAKAARHRAVALPAVQPQATAGGLDRRALEIHRQRGENLPFEPAAIALLARAAEGSMRDALSLLDQLIAFGGGAVNEADAAIDARHHRSRPCRPARRGVVARRTARRCWPKCSELDRDAPDYDRALVDLATLLQRIAIVQIVPEAAPQDEEFDAAFADAARAGDFARGRAALLSDRARRAAAILNMAPEPRIGFEMTLLRMLAFRPDAAAQPVESRRHREHDVAADASASHGAGCSAIGRGHKLGRAAQGRSSKRRGSTSIDAANWPAVVEAAGLSGMVRQLALNCVPAGFEHNLLTLKLDQAASDRRTRPIEEKLVQGLSKYLGRDIRLAFETAESDLNSPARQRVQAEQERVARAATAFESDPAVKGLRERFGADVDAASVKPSN